MRNSLEVKQMNTKNTSTTAIHGVLSDPRVLQIEREGQIWHSAVGIVQVLTESEHPEEFWKDLKAREPILAAMIEHVDFTVDEEGRTIAADALNLNGILRLIQSISSPRAERLKNWLIESALHRLAEAEDPELALLRARKLYEQRGYSRRWIDKRLRGISARHELTSEWYRRGARDGEQYRNLTNELVKSALGMDVETYRRYKSLVGNENLRDHMGDMELALVSLAETTAAVLHRERNSQGVEKLLADVKSAGEIVAGTVAEIQRRGGKVVNEGKRQKEEVKSSQAA
jgi:DNA-damage-inducible protein D